MTTDYAEQERAYRRAIARGVELSVRRSPPDVWSQRLQEHQPEFTQSIPSPPEPHSCSHCQKLVIDVSDPFECDRSGEFVYPKFLRFPSTLIDAREGAAAGCDLFSTILSQLKEPTKEEEEEGHYHIFAYGCMRDSAHEFDLVGLRNFGVIDAKRPWTKWNNKNQTDSSAPLAYLDVFTEEDNPASNFVTNRPVKVDPGSGDTLHLARSWLSECLRGHKDVSPPSERFQGRLPARLLRISQNNDGWALRLEQPNVDSIRYCALSYCWGPALNCCTTSANLTQRLVSLPYDLLPKTIQDAVMIAWKLDIAYLWVDALCIIQDDERDKAMELSKMSSVYANALLTICASRALYADEGLLHPRTPFVGQKSIFRLPYRLPSSGETGSVVIARLSACSQDNRLETRAWGFQERIMSKRILDIDGTTTSFSCCHDNGEADYRDGGPQDHARDWKAIDAFRKVLFEVEYRIQSGLLTMTHILTGGFVFYWYEIVRAYTEREATYPTDRIFAISGLAERFGSIAEDEYIAGLWLATIPWSLMWSMRDRDVRLPRPGKTRAAYQGPSWSWLGINGPVHFFDAKELRDDGAEIKMHYLGHELDLEYDAAPYGSLKSASLVVTGRTRKARWVRSDKVEPGGDYDNLAVHPSDRPVWIVPSDPITVDDCTTRNWNYAAEDLLPAQIYPDALEQEFAVPSDQGGADYLDVILLQAFSYHGTPVGLVLREAGEENEGAYERVGIFNFVKNQNRRYEEDQRDHDLKQGAGGDGQHTPHHSPGDHDTQQPIVSFSNASDLTPAENGMLSAELRNNISALSKQIDHDLQKRVQKQQDDQIWEKWKGWFDEDDCEEQVLVLI